jgi:broad specificity phosphatase PhoE
MILELEREQNDLLIIAHESVLRVLYGYLMACDAMNIPMLKFPRNEIIEVGFCSSFKVHSTNCLKDHPGILPERSQAHLHS